MDPGHSATATGPTCAASPPKRYDRGTVQPEGAALLDEVLASELFTAAELPEPEPDERQPPGAARQSAFGL